MYEMKRCKWKRFPLAFPLAFAYLLVKTLYFVKIKCYNIL